MIHSMTAFAREQLHDSWGNATWELRTVNHRYLEMSLRLPDNLKALEPAIRERASTKLKRGKLDCTLRFQPGAAIETEMTLNVPLIKALDKAHQQIAKITDSQTTLQAIDVLRWPSVVAIEEKNLQQFHHALLALLDKTLDQLVEQRSREGQALAAFIEQRLDRMAQLLKQANQLAPSNVQTQRKKLIERFDEAKISLDTKRLEEEMILFAQKLDVSEELDRLSTHMQAIHHTLQEGGSIGRRLDFLIQELNREANTVASKSNSTALTQCAVELKVLIEQMREQVQNIV